MAEKDDIRKTLESYPDVFADIINGFLFSGKQVVCPGDLIPADIASQYKADGMIRSQERDVSKYWRNNCFNIIACFGIENQSAPDKYMPMRIINYDGAGYGKQLKENKDKNFNGLYHPVVTIVLYFGDKPWNYGTSLSDCLDISEEFIPYVGDYRINLFDMHHVSAEDPAKFKSDFRHIVEFYAARNDDTDYIPSDAKLSHAGEIADFFRVFQNDERFITAYNEAKKDKEEITMCEFVDKLEARGEAKGRAEGRAEGRIAVLADLVKSGIITVMQAAQQEKMTVEEFKKKAGLTA